MSVWQAGLDRLDAQPPWRFTGLLYLLRWPVVLPVAFAIDWLSPSGPGSLQGMGINVVGALLLAPTLETLLECALPYWILRRLGFIPAGRRAWGFVAVAALLMMLLHWGAWPTAMLPSLVTGGFLGYTYAHFAPAGFTQAFLHTSAFHAGINLVGCILIALA